MVRKEHIKGQRYGENLLQLVSEFFFLESRFIVRLSVRIAFWLEQSAFRLRVSVEIDDLVFRLETSTFRVRVMWEFVIVISRVLFVELRFIVRLSVRIGFCLEQSAFRLRASVEIDELVLGLETRTFRVRVMVRICYSQYQSFFRRIEVQSQAQCQDCILVRIECILAQGQC